MGEIAKGVLQNLWAGLALGAAIGSAVAVGWTYLRVPLRKRNSIDEAALRDALEERQRLLLFCCDAKALADLAIQRHIGDALFLQRLRAQPCNAALSSHFSEDFRDQIAQEPDDREGRPALAMAYRKEIERLEQELRAAAAGIPSSYAD